MKYASPMLSDDPRRKPEARFRFSQPCIEEGCVQWAGSRCGPAWRPNPARPYQFARFGPRAGGPVVVHRPGQLLSPETISVEQQEDRLWRKQTQLER
jgi:hypothetical protein